MADRPWSGESLETPTDTDEVALRRGGGNAKWNFLGLRTWLESFFATGAELSAHTGAGNPHTDSASKTDLGAHTGNTGNPHSVTAAQANAIPAIADADGQLVPYDGTTYYKLAVGADGYHLTSRPGGAQAAKLVWEPPSGGGGNYQTIQDEGVGLPQQPAFNFVGSGVTATDDPGNNRTNITIAAGAAPVDSVFGRTGTVVAQAGDYTAVQVTNAADVTTINTFSATQQIIANASGVGWAVQNQNVAGNVFYDMFTSSGPPNARRFALSADAGNLSVLSLNDAGATVEMPLTVAHGGEVVFGGGDVRIENSAVVGLGIYQTGVVAEAGRWHIESTNGSLIFASLSNAGTPVAPQAEFIIAHGNFVGGQGAVMGSAAFQGHATLNAENGLYDGGSRVIVGPATADNEVIIGDGAAQAIKNSGVSMDDVVKRNVTALITVGFDADPVQVASGGTYTCNYQQHQFIEFTGSSSTTIAAPPAQKGAMRIAIPAAVASITLTGWATPIRGSDPGGDRMLECCSIGNIHIASWI